MALPQELNFNSQKSLAESAEKEIMRLEPEHSSYSQNSEIIINIPGNNFGAYLYPHSSFFEGSLDVTVVADASLGANSPAVGLDPNVLSLFSSYSIYHGSTLLEQSGHDICKAWCAVNDIQGNLGNRNGDSITMLSSETYSNFGLEYHFVNGVDISANDTVNTATLIPPKTKDFCFQLPSSIVGLLATKALPLSRINDKLQIRLQLNSALKAFSGYLCTPVNYTVSNFRFNAKISRLNPDLDSALMRAQPQVSLPGIAYKINSQMIAQDATSFSFTLNFSYSSVKSIFFFFQNQTTANGTPKTKCNSNRQFCNLQDFVLLMNGSRYPTSGDVSKVPRFYSELMRAWDCLNNGNHNTSLKHSNYAKGTGNSSDVLSSQANDYKFITGLDLDRFNHASNLMISGTNFINRQVQLQGTFSVPLPANVNIYAFVMYDTNTIIDSSGMMQTVF